MVTYNVYYGIIILNKNDIKDENTTKNIYS